MTDEHRGKSTRREFLRSAARAGLVAALGVAAGVLLRGRPGTGSDSACGDCSVCPALTGCSWARATGATQTAPVARAFQPVPAQPGKAVPRAESAAPAAPEARP